MMMYSSTSNLQQEQISAYNVAFLFITGFLLVYLTQSWWYKVVSSSFYKYKIAKGPFKIPFLSNTFHLLLYGNKRFENLQLVQEKFGDVFNIDVLGTFGVWICNPADIKHILVTNFANYEKGKKLAEPLLELFGQGIFVVDGDKWKITRKCMSYMFTTRLLKGYVSDVINKHLDFLCQLIQNKNDDSEKFYDFQQIISCFTLDTIGEIAFGANINSLKNGKSEFGYALDYSTAMCNARVVNPLWKIFRLIKVPSEREFSKCLEIINRYLYSLIQDCRKNTKQNKSAQNFDILSTITRTLDDSGQQYSVQFIRDVILSLVVAGRDTTANAISWAMYLLGMHPVIQEKLRQEILSYLQESQPEFAIVNNMVYIQFIVNETLRLYPSVPWDVKFSLKDDVLPSGYFVPKGTAVNYLIWNVNRSTKLWGEDANRFIPERWQGVQKEAYEFPVFNAGPRICLGVQLANLEIKYVLCKILQKFRIVLKPDQDVTYGLSTTLPVKNGLFLRLEPLN
eukprot:TRINITY_DN13656_c0_g1_i3.p2 TRINITY_DN13656_c0_g1~~TRINITY_DN13656_c0_g1_i3.p2  ORF type:complete len:516 (+),score=21.06 TRINITY_DN13656_c0_g1_i3:24-1550(+)